MTNQDGPRAKERAENVAVLSDPSCPTSDRDAAAEALLDYYSPTELLQMMREANR